MSESAVTTSPIPSLLRQLVLFGAVGGVGFVVDAGVFNVLRATFFAPEHLAGGAIAAKAVSTLLAILVNWIGNRTLTFRRARRGAVATAQEGLRFGVASGAGALATVLCLFVSHDILHLTSLLADNLSANVLGLGVGSAVRFVLHRSWVFRAA
jgi:putative flippase GtrA